MLALQQQQTLTVQLATNNMNEQLLIQFQNDAHTRETVREFMLAQLDKLALEYVYEQKDTKGIAEARNVIENTFIELKEEFKALRKSTDLLLKSLDETQLQHTGNASNHPITANAIAFIIFGHLLHHKHIIEERYL